MNRLEIAVQILKILIAENTSFFGGSWEPAIKDAFDLAEEILAEEARRGKDELER